jgi:hypothetical protein
MSFLRVVPAPLNSEWVLVVKGEKWVPLLNSFLCPIHIWGGEGGSVCINKGKAVVSPEMNGCAVGDMERRGNSFWRGEGGSVFIDKGKAVVSPEMNGCAVGDVERIVSLVDGTLPSLDLEVFLRVEPFPLSYCPR